MLTLTMIAASAILAQPFDPLSNISRPDLLPILRDVRVRSESSYDRTGGNDDGFSGKYSFVRKEGDTLVIAEMKGPGVVRRIWTPTPTDLPLEFYFDREETPRIKTGFRDLFLGKTPGFPEPLVGHGAGGFYSYVPIPYKNSLKIVYRGPVMQFFQINHETLPDTAGIASFSQDWVMENADVFANACKLMDASGKDMSGFLHPSSSSSLVSVRRNLAPGKKTTLFQSKKGGRIIGLRLGPAEAFAGKDRDILLSITFDGARKPAVLCPVGDFFGYSWGEPAMHSLHAGTENGVNYFYLPMPYEKSVKVELISERAAGSDIAVDADIVTADQPKTRDECRFYAVWRRENPTTIGVPFTFVKAEARGQVVGVTLQAQGMEPGSTPFFEGDDQCTIDGELAIHGTGSEDFFNGGWYDVPGRWDMRRSFPLSGCLDYKKHLGRSAAYRFMTPDPVVYHKSIHLAIEHAPEKNNILTDYVGVTYLYADRPPVDAGTVLPMAQRAVTEPKTAVMAAGWNIPIHAFSFEHGVLGKRVEKVGDREVRLLSLKAEGHDVFGEHFLEVLADVAAPGAYKLAAELLAGPDQGIVQLFRDEVAVGPKQDMRAESGTSLRTVELGTLDMLRGTNAVMLKLTHSNSSQIKFALDIVTLIFERISS